MAPVRSCTGRTSRCRVVRTAGSKPWRLSRFWVLQLQRLPAHPGDRPVAAKTKAKAKPAVQADAAPVTVLRKAWTWKYEPFQLGGMGGKPCQKPIAAMVECTGPYDLGQGFKGYLAVSPAGHVIVFECESGGIVGNDIAQVRADAKAATVAEMQGQVAEAKKYGEMAEVLTTEEFWRLYERGMDHG